MSDKSSILNDYEFIGKRAKVLDAWKRRVCISRAGLGTYVECWCFCAGPGGSTLSCDAATSKTEDDGA